MYVLVIENGRLCLPNIYEASRTKQFNINRGIFGFFVLYVLYSTTPPLRFHCVGGCWDRTQDC
jgi:hypothetical protein